MANFSPSNLVKAQLMVNDRYKAPENRYKQTPVLQLGLQYATSLIPDAAAMRTREDRSVSAYLLARAKRTAGSTRTHNHSGNRGDSIEQALTWGIYSDVFSISLKQMDNNLFGFEMALSQQLENAMKNIVEKAETTILTALIAAKTQVNIATKNGTFNSTNDAFEITGQDRFYQYLKSMMSQNYYTGEIDVIADPIAYANAEYQSAQGAGNATNSGFQFNGMNIVLSNELADATYVGADVVLAMQRGSFGLIPWIPKQNREGFGDYNSYVGGYGVINDPWGLGLTFAVHGYSQRADTSASNGNAQDVLMEFEVSLDLASAVAPLSTATETPIFEAVKV